MLPSLPLALLCIPCPPRIPPINEDPAVFVATWRAASRTPKNRVAFLQESRCVPPKIASRSQNPPCAPQKTRRVPPIAYPSIALLRTPCPPTPPFAPTNAPPSSYQRPTNATVSWDFNAKSQDTVAQVRGWYGVGRAMV